jgi:hypothetical protein
MSHASSAPPARPTSRRGAHWPPVAVGSHEIEGGRKRAPRRRLRFSRTKRPGQGCRLPGGLPPLRPSRFRKARPCRLGLIWVRQPADLIAHRLYCSARISAAPTPPDTKLICGKSCRLTWQPRCEFRHRQQVRLGIKAVARATIQPEHGERHGKQSRSMGAPAGRGRRSRTPPSLVR